MHGESTFLERTIQREWGVWKNKGKFSALMCISAHEWRETANFTYSGVVCSSFESAAHRWRTVPAKMFSLEQKYAQYLSSSRAHFRVTFDDIARSVEFNAPHGAIKTMPVYYSCVTTPLLYQNPLLIIATAPDGVKMLMKYCTTLLYGPLILFLSKMGRASAVWGILLSSLKD